MSRRLIALVACFTSAGAQAGDWPQWMGENRNAKVTGFTAPKTWPKELTQKWKLTIGEGVATPVLVGDKLYSFAWEGGKEILRGHNAETGKELWKDSYDCARATGPASGFAGARSTPAVADGRIIAFGARGTLSCYDTDGKKLWRKDSTGGLPRFLASSSPIIVDGLVIVQFGGEGKGGIAAYDLATGNEKWKWSDEGTAYASPSVLTIDGAKMLVAETDKSIVGVGVSDGKLLWKSAFAVTGGRGYNSSTPLVDGQTVIISGSNRGTKAIKIGKADGGYAAKELWDNKAQSVIFNTPIVANGLIYGLTSKNDLYCIRAETGKEGWTTPIRGRGGYGSIIDAGPVLMALTPSAQLLVFEAGDKEYKEVASYKVGSDTYAYPVLSGHRVYVKDKDSLTSWAIE